MFATIFRRKPHSAAGTAVTRRAIFRLGGATAAGAAAATAVSMANAAPAAAGVDGDVVLGSSDNTTTAATGVRVNGLGSVYGFGVTDNGTNSLDGMKPTLFVHAANQNFLQSVYVRARSDADGVVINAENGLGLAADGSGTETIIARNFGSGTAVFAQAGDGPGVTARGLGKGSAIIAETTSLGTGPAANVISGNKHPAIAATGIPVFRGKAVAAAGNGAALAVFGVAAFTRSGAVTLAGRASSVVVAVPGGLTASSNVLATMQSNTGAIGVRAAVPNLATGKVTIYLTGTAPKGAKIAWFVFG
jgi:hypothetical protein